MIEPRFSTSPLFEGVDPHSDLPLFLQVVDAFESALRTGRLRPAQKLPTEAELGAQFGVSRKTLRRATGHLEKLGLIQRTQGVGTIVTEEARVDEMSARRSLQVERASTRRTPETRLLCQQRVNVDVELSCRTGFHVGAELLHLRRLRLVDGKPQAILENLVPTRLVPEFGDRELNGSFLELLRRQGIRSELIRRDVDAMMPSADQAAALGIDVATPFLCERISNLDAEGEIFNLSTNYLHPVNCRMTTLAHPERDVAPTHPRSTEVARGPVLGE
jgi:GntR family transcriptional regulator